MAFSVGVWCWDERVIIDLLAVAVVVVVGDVVCFDVGIDWAVVVGIVVAVAAAVVVVENSVAVAVDNSDPKTMAVAAAVAAVNFGLDIEMIRHCCFPIVDSAAVAVAMTMMRPTCCWSVTISAFHHPRSFPRLNLCSWHSYHC